MAQNKFVTKTLKELKGRIYEERLYFQCPICKPPHTCVIPFKSKGFEMKGQAIEEATVVTPTKFIAGPCGVFFSLIDGVIYAKEIRGREKYGQAKYEKRDDTDSD